MAAAIVLGISILVQYTGSSDILVKHKIEFNMVLRMAILQEDYSLEDGHERATNLPRSPTVASELDQPASGPDKASSRVRSICCTMPGLRCPQCPSSQPLPTKAPRPTMVNLACATGRSCPKVLLRQPGVLRPHLHRAISRCPRKLRQKDDETS